MSFLAGRDGEPHGGKAKAEADGSMLVASLRRYMRRVEEKADVWEEVGAGLPELWVGLDRGKLRGREVFCPQCKCALRVPDYYPRWYNWACWFAAFGASLLMILHVPLKRPIGLGTAAFWLGVVFNVLCLGWFLLLRVACIRLAWRFFPPDVVDPRKARYVSLG